MRVTNNSGISLPLAIWLVHDEYDHVQGVPNYISVTTLMKPLKQIILPGRIPADQVVADVGDMAPRRLGHAIHDSIERAWIKGGHRAMRLLGYPESVIARLLVNPTTEQLRNVPDPIVVWLENRGHRRIEIDGTTWTVGGKFDMVSDGILNDNKSTSAYGWVFGTREKEHRLQMSLYRWIDAKRTDGEAPRVTEEFCNVNYVFTDWQRGLARSNPRYPQKRVEQTVLILMSLDETEAFVQAKLRLIARNASAAEADMPPCSDEELWRSDPTFKYFSDSEKAKVPGARSTKNFDSLSEAMAHRAQQGRGVVVTKPGEVKACGYCPAYDACEQKDLYFQ